jgi:hypothetical protein
MRIIYVLNTYCKVLSKSAASDYLGADLAVRHRHLRVIEDRSSSCRYLIGVRPQWSHWLALARVATFFTQKSHAVPVTLATS